MINSCCYRVDLPKPKSMTVRATVTKEKLNNLQNLVRKCITHQATSDLTKLFDEGALISRMCCKVKKKFRGEKLFRRLKQITISIKKLYCINIPEVMLNLLSTFENGMPSKQAGLWAGTRILAATLLIDQLQQFTEGVARLLVKVLQNGQCWFEMNIALAMVSRIWILSKSLYRSFLHSYQNYRPLVNQMKMSESKYLSNIELPKNPKCDLLDNNSASEELVERPGSVMSRKPESEEAKVKKRKRPGKQIRLLQENDKNKVKIKKKQKIH